MHGYQYNRYYRVCHRAARIVLRSPDAGPYLCDSSDTPLLDGHRAPRGHRVSCEERLGPPSRRPLRSTQGRSTSRSGRRLVPAPPRSQVGTKLEPSRNQVGTKPEPSANPCCSARCPAHRRAGECLEGSESADRALRGKNRSAQRPQDARSRFGEGHGARAFRDGISPVGGRLIYPKGKFAGGRGLAGLVISIVVYLWE